MDDTADRARTIIAEHLGWPKDAVTDDASFIDDLRADSLDLVELVMAAEDEFGIEIRDDDAETWLVVRDAIRRLETLRANSN